MSSGSGTKPGSLRIIGYDLIRVVAAAMVVAIHSNVHYLEVRDGSANWHLTMQLTALCVVAVPLFFMVSGAVNLGRPVEVSFKGLFRRKIPKIFIPFAIWSCIYVVARMLMHKIPVTADGFVSLFWEPAYYQFWFMYTLLGLYLLIPIFQFIIWQADKRVVQYVLILWLLCSVLLPLAIRYIPGFKISHHFDMVLLEGYWGYFVLGGYLHKYPPRDAQTLGWVLIVAGVILTSVCSIVEWLYAPNYYGYVYCAYLLPGAVAASIGCFILLSKIKISEKLVKPVSWLAALSMGVYYVHTLIMSASELFFNKLGYGIEYVLLKWALICIVSVLVIELIRRTKFLKKILL